MILSIEEENSVLSDPWVNEKYADLIGEELVTLDDFIPPCFITARFIVKRNRWLKENNKRDLIRSNREYKLGWFRLESGSNRTIFDMETMLTFIEKYPGYSQLIKNPKEFNEHLQILYKEQEDSK